MAGPDDLLKCPSSPISDSDVLVDTQTVKHKGVM